MKTKKESVAIKKTMIMVGTSVLFLLLATGLVFQGQIRKVTADKFVVAGDYYYNGGAYNVKVAEILFDVAIKLNPQTDTAYYQLARIHLVGNELDLARTEIDESLAINPANVRAFYVRGLIDGYDHKYPEAISDFQKFVAWAPTEWAGYNDLAWVYYLNKDYEKTRETAQTGLDKTGENNPWLLNGLGVAYVNLKEPQEAQKFFDQAKSLAADLTPQKWANAYPGNNPDSADSNLNKFRTDLDSNSQLALGGFTSGGVVASACGSSTPAPAPSCSHVCTCNACRGHVCGYNGCGEACLGNITIPICFPHGGGGPSPPPPPPPCSPSCSGSCSSTCVGTSCGGDGCGGTCYGSKSPNYVPVCLYSDADSCTQSNCNKEITTKTAYCVGISNNGCGPLQKNNFSGCSSCNVQKTTCPPCSWREVAP